MNMSSRTPSRRSTPHSRDSSHRSPSYGLRGSSRRGRSPPVEPRRRKDVPRSGGHRSSEVPMRVQRGAEFRGSERSMPTASYQQAHFTQGPSSPGSPPPRKVPVKRRSYTPPLSALSPSSGKRKRIQRMRSTSSSSSSLDSVPHLPLQLPPRKPKIISANRMPPSREQVMVPVSKRSRSRSPLSERGHMTRGTNHFAARAVGDELKKEPKGSSYATSLPKVSAQFSDSSRQIENSQKRFAGEPVRRFSREEDENRPIYRGPDGKGPTFQQHELKKITVEIHRSIPANEIPINRQIFNPEDVVVVRRPGEGKKPIFDRDELRHAPPSSDEVEVKYQDRESGRQLSRTTREEHSRNPQPIEQKVVAIIDDKPVLPSTSLQSLRGQVRRSRSPIASVSHMGTSRLESISPTPMVIEKPRPYYEASPPPSRMAGGYGSSSSRHLWDYDEPGPSHSRNPSHPRHKEGRRNEDLRYELENRRRDDTSYDRGEDFRGDSDDTSSDLRMRINEKRTTDHPRMSRYPRDVDEHISNHPKGERQYASGHQMEVMHDQRRRGMENIGHRSVAHLEHEMDDPDDYHPRGSIPMKSSSSTVMSWDGNPEYVPKGRAYYEHDNRDEWVRVTSSQRGTRGYYIRGSNRGRYFRGGRIPRGRGRARGRGRGQYMGHILRGYSRGGGNITSIRRQSANTSSTGGGHVTRGKPLSPNLWKHDMFENLSSDENKPTSTSDKG